MYVKHKKNLIHHIFHLWVEILVIFLHGRYEGMIKKHRKQQLWKFLNIYFS